MQGQPGLAVDKYGFLCDLITGLCKTKEFSTADHGTRHHAIKLILEQMAATEEIQWLECQHYRELLPDQLEELFGTVFNKTDTGDSDQVFIQQFKAARRALVLATAQACGDTTAPETWRSMLSGHFCNVARLAKQRDSGSPLAYRLKALGYIDRSLTHERKPPSSDKCCYDVDLVADLKQMLQNDSAVVADVAASQARWRALAAELTGAREADRRSAADVLTDVESGVLFRSRVLPVVDTLSPNELLMVGLAYMDDVDVTNDKGPSAGVHQQNMQYVMWLNLSPHLRLLTRNIRLLSCCNTSLTKAKSKAGFPFVISDPTDETHARYSLASQARRLC
jgi:hypothetical protein